MTVKQWKIACTTFYRRLNTCICFQFSYFYSNKQRAHIFEKFLPCTNATYSLAAKQHLTLTHCITIYELWLRLYNQTYIFLLFNIHIWSTLFMSTNDFASAVAKCRNNLVGNSFFFILRISNYKYVYYSL